MDALRRALPSDQGRLGDRAEDRFEGHFLGREDHEDRAHRGGREGHEGHGGHECREGHECRGGRGREGPSGREDGRDRDSWLRCGGYLTPRNLMSVNIHKQDNHVGTKGARMRRNGFKSQVTVCAE